MKKTFWLFLLFAASLVAASSGKVALLSPLPGVIGPGDTLDLGTIGPGQTVEIIADAGAGAPSSLKQSANADWDHFEVVDASLPEWWTKKDGLIYERKFSAFVTAAKDAKDGTYSFNIRASDEYEGVEPLVFRVRVRISRDVLGLSVSPKSVVTGVGVPAVYDLTISNNGRAADVFTVTVSGMPVAWDYSQKIYVAHDSQRTIRFEAGASEQGEHSILFKATSLSSNEITASAPASLVAQASLLQDVMAAANGVVLFPSAQQAVVAALGFLAKAFG